MRGSLKLQMSYMGNAPIFCIMHDWTTRHGYHRRPARVKEYYAAPSHVGQCIRCPLKARWRRSQEDDQDPASGNQQLRESNLRSLQRMPIWTNISDICLRKLQMSTKSFRERVTLAPETTGIMGSLRSSARRSTLYARLGFWILGALALAPGCCFA